MESIIDILHKGGYSCVMKNREEVRTFTQRGERICMICTRQILHL